MDAAKPLCQSLALGPSPPRPRGSDIPPHCSSNSVFGTRSTRTLSLRTGRRSNSCCVRDASSNPLCAGRAPLHAPTLHALVVGDKAKASWHLHRTNRIAARFSSAAPAPSQHFSSSDVAWEARVRLQSSAFPVGGCHVSTSPCATRANQANTAAPAEASCSEAVKNSAASLVNDLRGTSIFLIGMMGSGKSTVGRILAEALGYCFFDSDEIVEQAAGGASVSQIFEENGEEAFRNLETQVLSELSSLGRVVVSTGGGAVLRTANWSYMDHGITVFIDVPVPLLASRVVAAGTASRPLLATQNLQGAAQNSEGAQVSLGQQTVDTELQENEETAEASVRLQKIFDQRSELYRNADATASLQRISKDMGVECGDVSPEDIAIEVLGCIKALVVQRRLRDQKVQAKAA